MTLSAGTRLGPYEILSPLGAGGMGEVYRARDTRLEREVAIKVLPGGVANAERLRRFETEARSASSLNHPNIVTIHDIGSEAGVSYIAMELVSGDTLRTLVAGGPISTRKLFAIATQVAEGLSRAHEAGIIHRDLKPENVMVTKDGFVKILDFGLAKLSQPEDPTEVTQAPTISRGTEPGLVMGTVGYMSPEQAAAKPADFRSDQFAFGTILYEMATGRRAFGGDTVVDTLSAILHAEPEPIAAVNPSVPVPLRWIVERCLAKEPGDRYVATRDLARELASVQGHLSEASSGALPAVTEPRRRSAVLLPGMLVGALGLLVLGIFGGRWLTVRGAKTPVPTFRQLTRLPQTVFRAAFAPDGKTVFYSSALKGNTPEIFSVSPDSPIPRPLGFGAAYFLSVSSKGELLILVQPSFVQHGAFVGTLAQAPMAGGAPRPILEGVREADWAPDGQSFLVVREIDGKDRIEYPAGKVLFETGGYVNYVRFSPKGDRIAFLEHPGKWDDRGNVSVVDLAGRKTTLLKDSPGEEGLAWSRDGLEVMASISAENTAYELCAVSLSGRARTPLRIAGSFVILDVSTGGSWLGTRSDLTFGVRALPPGSTGEVDLSLSDSTFSGSVSEDGGSLLFWDADAGPRYTVMLRSTAGSPPVRLGEGVGAQLSPDGHWALAYVATTPYELLAYPTGAGAQRRLPSGPISTYNWAMWFPDGRSVLSCGSEPGRADRCYAQEFPAGSPRAVTPEGTRWGVVSPDGRGVLAQSVLEGAWVLYPLDGGAPRRLPFLARQDRVIRWSGDGRSVFVFQESRVPTPVERVALDTGRRELLRNLSPPDLTSVMKIQDVSLSADGAAHAYTVNVWRSQLFLVEGAR